MAIESFSIVFRSRPDVFRPPRRLDRFQAAQTAIRLILKTISGARICQGPVALDTWSIESFLIGPYATSHVPKQSQEIATRIMLGPTTTKTQQNIVFVKGFATMRLSGHRTQDQTKVYVYAHRFIFRGRQQHTPLSYIYIYVYRCLRAVRVISWNVHRTLAACYSESLEMHRMQK